MKRLDIVGRFVHDTCIEQNGHGHELRSSLRKFQLEEKQLMYKGNLHSYLVLTFTIDSNVVCMRLVASVETLYPPVL